MCRVIGCHEPTHVVSIDLCKLHYGRHWRGRPLIRVRETMEEQFCRHIDKSNAAGCWLWTGGKDKNGYGLFTFRGQKTIRATRYMWEITHGISPQPGVFVCHRCDNPSCCNPKHLFLGTSADNSADMMRKGRWAGSPTEKLTKEQRAEIRSRPHDGYGFYSRLAREFGVSPCTARRIHQSTDDQLLAITNGKLAQLVPETA